VITGLFIGLAIGGVIILASLGCLKGGIMAIFKHPRDKVGDFQVRMLIHIPIGILIGLASLIPFTKLGKNLSEHFLKYERNEDAHTEDEAWKDIYGSIVGQAIVATLAVGGFVYLLYYLAVRFL
jgi:hypothetical protein